MKKSKYYFLRKSNHSPSKDKKEQTPKLSNITSSAPFSIKKLIKNLKEEKDIQFDFNFEKNNGEPESVDEIKVDYLKLSKHYVLLFAKFKEKFEGLDPKLDEFINKHQILSIDILNLSNDKSIYASFTKNSTLNSYIGNNYFELIEFFNMCLEVFELE